MGVTELPFEAEIRQAFEMVIENPSDGVPSDSGFDDETSVALFFYCKFPSEKFAEKAREELEKQFDGRHKRDRDGFNFLQAIRAKLK